MVEMNANDNKISTRRRGKELEDAILQAAWDEISAEGYGNLTIEKVAERAKTSKTVIYRRWPNRAELALAAVRFHSPYLSGEVEVPDTGSLRGDCLELLRRHPLQEANPEFIRGLMGELSEVPLANFFGQFAERGIAVKAILKRAKQRGEIRMDKLHQRIILLPTDLLRQEVLLNHESISDDAIVEIVDKLFLPLVYLNQTDEPRE